MGKDELGFKRRFNDRSTATQVLQDENIEGKTFLVTGGSSGIGTATVEALVRKGGIVAFTGRNTEASVELIAKLKSSTPYAKVEFMGLDLSSFKDVRRFAQEFLSKYQKLDVVIFNAGMFAGSHAITEDGYEQAFQVNLLGQLYLLELLKPLLLNPTPSRIVFVSSELHRQNNLSLDRISEKLLSPTESSTGWRQYANSKFCQILLSSYIQEHWGTSGVTSYSLHPGAFIATNLVRGWTLGAVLAWMCKPFTKSLNQGAATTVYCAAAAELANQGGKYWNHCWLSEPTIHGNQSQLAEAVWNLCQKMIKAKVPGYVPS